jgi:protocatechuate 3,4-dioxygenase beta subunit
MTAAPTTHSDSASASQADVSAEIAAVETA